jgi:hypothetical protein
VSCLFCVERWRMWRDDVLGLNIYMFITYYLSVLWHVDIYVYLANDVLVSL